MRRHEDGIEGAGGRAHEQIGGDAPLAQRLQHADLDRPRLPPPESTKAVVIAGRQGPGARAC